MEAPGKQRVTMINSYFALVNMRHADTILDRSVNEERQNGSFVRL
jgi:hypothetical protein